MSIIQVEENLRFVLSTAPHIFWDQPTRDNGHLLHKLAWFPSQCMEKHGTSWLQGSYKIHTSCNAPPGFCTPGRHFSVTCFTRSFQDTQTHAVNQVQVSSLEESIAIFVHVSSTSIQLLSMVGPVTWNNAKQQKQWSKQKTVPWNPVGAHIPMGLEHGPRFCRVSMPGSWAMRTIHSQKKKVTDSK